MLIYCFRNTSYNYLTIITSIFCNFVIEKLPEFNRFSETSITKLQKSLQ